MKIYFAGAIRGGRDDAALYLEIVTRLRAYGEVLTEHVADDDLSVLGESKDDRWIHDRDPGCRFRDCEGDGMGQTDFVSLSSERRSTALGFDWRP